jgi:hypothetical protein
MARNRHTYYLKWNSRTTPLVRSELSTLSSREIQLEIEAVCDTFTFTTYDHVLQLLFGLLSMCLLHEVMTMNSKSLTSVLHMLCASSRYLDDEGEMK